ncbi:PstS family phosphate ABC transporter substrate-binding protein [Ferrovibrio terrae]|nr:substrate-binding domain-containing protein [Ferrovibrio terrae]
MGAPAYAADIIRVGGTGMGLALMRIVGTQVEREHPAIQTQVLPSLGTTGGLKALAAGAIEVAIATRKATPEENAAGIRTAACMTTALIFATSRSQNFNLTREELPALYSASDPRWPDGQPLKVILRSRTGSENPYLVKAIPALEPAFAAAFRRSGIPVGATDQENAEFAQKTAGSLAITTLLQVRTEKLNLTPLALDGVVPSPQSIADGSYSLPLPVCLLVRENATPATRLVASYITTPAGQAVTRANGAEPSP